MALEEDSILPELTDLLAEKVPSYIGPYRIESLYKKGGMSLLYLAIDEKNQKPVILKVLSEKFAKNPHVVERFLKEAEIIKMTHHPNIVQILDQGSFEKGLFIALELIQGISLKNFIQSRSFSLRKTLDIVLQVAYALCHLHSYGVIHRDLKPNNILICENGGIKVIDFGVAQLFDEKKSRIKVGTPSYMSPEQKEKPQEVSFTSDIYSLGVIFYELVIGQQSQGKIIFDLIPKTLRPLLEKVLEVDPQKRMGDIVDFISELSLLIKKEEMKEISEDLSDFIKSPFNKLFKDIKSPTKTYELELIFEKGLSLIPLIFEVKKIKEDALILFFAEASEKTMSSLFSSYELKGFFHHLVEESKEKDFMPENFIPRLQKFKSSLEENQRFLFSYFYLSTSISYFASSEKTHAFLMSPSKKYVALSTPNLLLGSGVSEKILQTSFNFTVGERILLMSTKIEEAVEKTLKEEKDFIDKFFSYPLTYFLQELFKKASKLVKSEKSKNLSSIFGLEKKG